MAGCSVLWEITGTDYVSGERVARIAGSRLFTDQNMVNRLFNTDQTVFRKIKNWISDALTKVFGSEERKELLQAEKLYLRAMNSRGQVNGYGEGQNFIGTTKDGEKFVVVNQDEINTSDGANIASNIAKILKKYNNLILANGQYIRVNSHTNGEFRESDWARGLRKENAEWHNDKIKTLANADEILTAAKGWVNEAKKHERTDDITSFGRGEILYKVGENGYSADVLVGLKDDGSAVLHDIVNINEKKIDGTDGGEEREPFLSSDSQSISGDSIAQGTPESQELSRKNRESDCMCYNDE